MAISQKRKVFRRFLYVVMGFSFLFMATSAYFYRGVRSGDIDISEIRPTLYAIDIAHYQASTYFQTQDQQFETAKELWRRGFFGREYGEAAIVMIKDLSDKGHAPAQLIHAEIILSSDPDEQQVAQAMSLFKSSADQGHLPAKRKLVLMERAEKLAKSGPSL